MAESHQIVPLRTHYRTATESTKLPFVSRRKQPDGSNPVRFWAVDPVEDYCDGCHLGTEYAAHYLQYLQDNPSPAVGTLLTQIVKDIDFTDPKKKGLWVGFFSFLEKVLIDRARTMNVYVTLDAQNARRALIRAEIDEEERAADLLESTKRSEAAKRGWAARRAKGDNLSEDAA